MIPAFYISFSFLSGTGQFRSCPTHSPIGKVGDRITIRFGQRTLAVEVVSVQDNVGKADAAAMYREIPAGDSLS